MPNTNQPLVSVIMPVYNCDTYVEDAINSILTQTYTNLEIIVVDDGSTDNTWGVVQKLAKTDKRLKPIRNAKNSRIVVTLNNGIRKSTGKYLARMDGDDIREPDSIWKQVEFLEAHPDVVVVGGTARFCDSNMKPLNDRSYPQTDAEIRAVIFRYSPFCHASILMRASALEKDPYRYDWAEDYDLYFRLGKAGKMANLSDVLYLVRTHKASVSRTKTRYQEKLTLYLRLKAIYEYGWTMKASDRFYFAAQISTLYLMPSSWRFWIFNKLRAS